MMPAKMRNKLSPAFLWTEIMSVIKGSHKSRNYDSGYLPMHVYMEANENFDPLQPPIRKSIYYVFLQYEQWKTKSKAFDFLDIV